MKKYYFILIVFTFSTVNILACECDIIPYETGINRTKLIVEKSYNDTDIVFYGKYLGDWKFQITKQYKGSKTKIITLTSEQSLCDYFFQENQKYLVYGNVDEKGFLWTSVCVANRLISKKSDLKASTQFFTSVN